jgi:hypothetical protein
MKVDNGTGSTIRFLDFPVLDAVVACGMLRGSAPP